MLTVLAAVLMVPIGPAGNRVRPSAAARAAAQADTATGMEVELTRVDAVVTGGDDVVVVARVRNTGPSVITDITGTLTVHDRFRSRFAYQRVLDAGMPDGADVPEAIDGRPRADVDRVLADVEPGATRFLAIAAAPSDLGVPTGAGAQSVHPMQLTITGRVGGGERRTLAAVTTALVVMSTTPERPLQVAVLLPLGTDVVGHTDPARESTAALADDVRGLTAALAATDAPVSVTVDNALAAVADDAVGDAVAELLADPHLERLTVPYAEADLPALNRGGLEGLAGLALRLGAQAWPGTDARPDPGLLVPRVDIDDGTLETVIVPFGARAVVLDREQLAVDPAQEPATTPSPVRLLSTRRSMTAVVPDPWLREALTENAELTPLQAHRVLAETALLYLERPGGSEMRGVLLAPVDARTLSPGGLRRLLEELAAAPWAELSTVQTLAEEVAPGPPARLAYDSSAIASELPASYVEEIAAARTALSSLAAVVGETDPALLDLRNNVALAASIDVRGDLPAGRALLAAVDGTAAELLGAVRVIGRPTVTFTDAVGQLPVVLRNTASVPLTVEVHLSSSRLRFPGNGREVELEPDSTTTVLFDAEARTPGGTAPVDVRVTDPGGATQLAAGSVVVRIAAYPMLALMLIGGAAAAIVLWGVRELRSRRRPEEEAAEVPPARVDAA